MCVFTKKFLFFSSPHYIPSERWALANDRNCVCGHVCTSYCQHNLREAIFELQRHIEQQQEQHQWASK